MRRFVWMSFFLLAVAVLSLPAWGQVPQEFTNLQVLHKEIGRGELIGAMREFAGALGVRCNHCHVGENPDNLEGYDFASDQKEPKRVARQMLRMVQDINQNHLTGLGRESTLRVECVTCHRGLTRPESLTNRILATVEKEGAEAAVKLYRDLREKHYGGASYDFNPGPLNSVTEALSQTPDKLPAAEAIIRLNIEFHPASHYSHFLLAQVLRARGDTAGAIASLEKAIEINPDSGFYKGQLERLKTP